MDRPPSPTNYLVSFSQGSLATSGERILAHPNMLAPTIQPKGSLMQHINEPTKTIIDGLSVATVLGALTAWLPPIAALFTIIWTAIRIYETPTVQTLLARWRSK